MSKKFDFPIIVNGKIICDDPTTISDVTTKNYTDKHLMIGSANANWIPCSIDLESNSNDIYVYNAIDNVNANDVQIMFRCPLPTNRGGKKLYISGLRIHVRAADNDDYVNRIIIYGALYTGIIQLNVNTDDIKTQSNTERTFIAIDCSNYHSILPIVDLVCTTVRQISITGISIRCYYD